MSSSIIIIGTGGHAASITNVALSSAMNIEAYVDDNKAGKQIDGIKIISKQECIDIYQNSNFAIAIGDNSVRERVFNEFKLEIRNAKFPPLIHSSSVIGINSKVGEGSVIMPNVNVGPNSKIGMFCILNTSSSIDHDCHMNSFSSLAPGVVTGGNISLGIRSAISIGASVKHGICIGDDVVIGANSYVNEPVKNNVVAYGVPCRFVRDRTKDDKYLL
tara:strand:+ start:605 stop:1255 length:651 start_codon:yes stop_codon:yes gene_type:complete